MDLDSVIWLFYDINPLFLSCLNTFSEIYKSLLILFTDNSK